MSQSQILVGALLCLSIPSAATDFGRWGLQYSAGGVTVHGGLGDDSARVFHDLQIITPSIATVDASLEAYLSINVLMFRTQNSKSLFAFPDENLRFLNFLFIANICPRADNTIDFCLGLGQGTVNVNSSSERRDYGSWNYQALVRYRPDSNWSAQLLAKYVGKVEQTRASQNSSFGFFALGAGVAHKF